MKKAKLINWLNICKKKFIKKIIIHINCWQESHENFNKIKLLSFDMIIISLI